MAKLMMETPVTIDISSEQFREYIYDDGNVLVIHDPLELYITQSGSHRVIAADGRTYRPTPGYLGISWRPKAGHPAFVA